MNKKTSKTYDIPKKLTFSIDNLDRDVTVKFDYNPEIDLFDKHYIVDRPFEVCIKNECKVKVKSYDFKKGNSYKIIVELSMWRKGDNYTYYIPGFEFYDINYEGIDSPDDIDYDNYYRGLKLKNLMIFLMLLSLL